MRRSSLILLGAALAAMAGPALAGPISAAAILQQYNLVVFGDAATQADIEGAAVIGGNLRGATIYNHPRAAQPAAGALTVYGSTSGNPINLNNGGNAYVAGTRGAIVNFNGGGSYQPSSPYVIDDLRSPLTALSASLAGLAATSLLPAPTNNEVITAVPGRGGIAVFNVTAADLAAIPSYRIDLNGASSVIFNVAGDSASFGANLQGGIGAAEHILWNFYEATGDVILRTQLSGSVLAPYATVTNDNEINGVLVARQWNGRGEIHDWQFAGSLPSPEPGGGPAVPEPASVLMLLGGLAILAVARPHPGPAPAKQ